MRQSTRRLFVMVLMLPVVLFAFAWLYMLGMTHLEGQPRDFVQALTWAAETVTSVGYGADGQWAHPAMIGFVVLVQFAGVFLIFLVVPVFLLPFIEERFEGRLPRTLPALKGHVVIYGYGPAVATLIDELDHAEVSVTVVEEDEAVARRLLEQGRSVVFARLEDEVPDLANLESARALVLNGEDHNNAVLAMTAREMGFEGPIVALVENPYRRNPMLLAGATAAFTPPHVLAAAVAAKASPKINPRVAGAQQIGKHLDVAELRLHDQSSLAGKTLAEAKIRERTGATIIGQWVKGELVEQPPADERMKAGTILLAAGSHESLERLGEITRPITRDGPLIVAGFGAVGKKVVEFLNIAGENVSVIAREQEEGVDVVGDALDRKVLERAGIGEARAVVLALENDSATLFAATVVRDMAPEVAIIASVNRAHNVGRIQRAGADFTLSVSQVAGQLLTHHVLGEDSVSVQTTIKLVKVAPGELEAKNPITSHVLERTGCSIVAVERGDDVLVEFDSEFALEPGDAVYVCGTQDAVARYYEVFPGARG